MTFVTYFIMLHWTNTDFLNMLIVYVFTPFYIGL